ncbi:MAG: PHP domain-containing protein [Bacillota bacterium]|nr:PHP domain-containing protein [Bacillota bacterium]
MLVDIHIHELNGSLDSQLNIFKAIEKAENRNLDAICITDHDSLYLRDKIMKIILDKITKKYSDNIALKDISIEI